MLTDFGKALRKMRIDHGEFLRDMAAKLNVTVAYLSAVENGRREVPDNWIGELANQYKLSNEERKDSLKIDLSGIQAEEKELALAFARTFKNLSEEDKKRMKDIFDKGEE